MQKQWLTWNQTQYPIQWNANLYTWDEVYVTIQITQFFPDWLEYPKKKNQEIPSIGVIQEKVPQEKLDFFIKVVCKVNNLDYEKRKMRKTKPIVTVKEISKTFETMKSIKVSLVGKDI